MTAALRLGGRAAIVGIGTTTFYKRGASLPATETELVCHAIRGALDDAGLSAVEVDGFAYQSGGYDSGLIARYLGVADVRFSVVVTGGGGGSAATVELAALAVASGQATTVVAVSAVQQSEGRRLGSVYAPSSTVGRHHVDESTMFTSPYGAISPAHMFAVIASRHMHLFGTSRKHFAHLCISQRAHAATRPTALHRSPLTLEAYFDARMISDPLCLYDCSLESDGAAAVIVTSVGRARDLRQRPVVVAAAAHGASGAWNQGPNWMGMKDDLFASAGAKEVALRAYSQAGIGPEDIDVALLYDNFSPMVLMQLEDCGFCGRGESGSFVEEGHVRWPSGSIPVNTHGGNLSEAYVRGMTHIVEGVEQLRGTAINQVANAEVALVTGGPSETPTSALVLTR